MAKIILDAPIPAGTYTLVPDGPPPPPPPPPGPAWPSASEMGVSAVKRMDIEFGPPGSGPGRRRYVTDPDAFTAGNGLSTSPGFGLTEALVLVWTTPLLPDSKLVLGVTETGTSNGGSATRTFVVSESPGDFRLSGPGVIWSDMTGGMSWQFSVGGTGRWNLQPGKTYYCNIKNSYNGIPGSDKPRCDVYVTPSNP